MSDKLYQLSMLPNTDGYRFVGVTKDGYHKVCRIKRCPITGLHFVQSGASFDELVGWYPYDRTKVYA